MHVYHVDHLGPLESTNKNYKHIFAIIDSFTKFFWLYLIKTMCAAEVIDKLELQKSVFASPFHIISDRGAVFIFKEFTDYCSKENISHHIITTGLSRAYSQIERLN